MAIVMMCRAFERPATKTRGFVSIDASFLVIPVSGGSVT
jgi:hypothetical protein